MKSSYEQMVEQLSRKSYSAALTKGVVALFIISLLLLAAALVIGSLQKNNPGLLPLFIISLGGGALGFTCSFFWYLEKAREYVRAESVELDLKHPGFFEYYEAWRYKIDKITSSD